MPTSTKAAARRTARALPNIPTVLRLDTAKGRCGLLQLHIEGAAIVWDETRGDDETISATFRRAGDWFMLKGDDWRRFEDSGADPTKVHYWCERGVSLAAAVLAVRDFRSPDQVDPAYEGELDRAYAQIDELQAALDEAMSRQMPADSSPWATPKARAHLLRHFVLRERPRGSGASCASIAAEVTHLARWEGWCCEDNGRIVVDREMDALRTDEAALSHVTRLCNVGSQLHALALALHEAGFASIGPAYQSR